MQDLLFNLLSPTIIILCCAIGSIIKHFVKRIDNKYIPLIVACLGIIFSCIMIHGITLDAIAQGIISGWASTGVHQTFKQLGGKANG